MTFCSAKPPAQLSWVTKTFSLIHLFKLVEGSRLAYFRNRLTRLHKKWTLIMILLKTLTFHFQLVQLLPSTICRCFKHRDGFLLVSTFLFTLTPPPHILCSNQLELEQRVFGCKTSITFTRRSGVGRPPRTPARLPHYCLGIWFGCFLPTANILKVPHITTKHHLYYLQRLALKAQC